MIALVATFLIAVYILGPDLVARWVLGFVVPRKNLVQTRSEEITRGVLWSVVPLSLAWSLRHVGPLAVASGSRVDVQVFFSGLYSAAFFDQHRAEFFSAAASFVHLNLCILVRLYSIVVVSALVFNFLILHYGRLRAWMGSRPFWARLRPVLSTVVLPRIAEWHVILSDILLPSKDMKIEVDILTKAGIVYQGGLSEKVLASDGSLQTITLRSPRRFRRDVYLEERKAGAEVEADDFWKPIPGNLFVVMASEIATLNVRYMPGTVRRFGREFKEIAEAIRQLDSKIKQIERREGVGE